MRIAFAIVLLFGCATAAKKDVQTVDMPEAQAHQVADEAVQRRIAALNDDPPYFPRRECERTREGYRATVGACAGGIRVVLVVTPDCIETSRGKKWFLPDGGQIVRFDGDMAIYWYDSATLQFREEKWRACDGGRLPESGPIEGKGGMTIYWGPIPYEG